LAEKVGRLNSARMIKITTAHTWECLRLPIIDAAQEWINDYYNKYWCEYYNKMCQKEVLGLLPLCAPLCASSCAPYVLLMCSSWPTPLASLFKCVTSMCAHFFFFVCLFFSIVFLLMEEGVCFDHLLVELDLGEKPLLFSFDPPTRTSRHSNGIHTSTKDVQKGEPTLNENTFEIAKYVASSETGIFPSCFRVVGMSSPSCSWGVVRLSVKGGLVGGKGGYGANIRHQQARPGSKKTSDFGAMRDVHGRRIRSVQAHELLRRAERAEKKEGSEGGGVEEKGEKGGETPSVKKREAREGGEKERGVMEKMERTKHTVRSRLDAALSGALVSLQRQRGRKKVDQEKTDSGGRLGSESPSGSDGEDVVGDEGAKVEETTDTKTKKRGSKEGTICHLDPLDLIDWSDEDEDEDCEDD
jgi:hypothetical protein